MDCAVAPASSDTWGLGASPRALALPPGSVVAMDRAYLDFRLFTAWNERGVFFVTPHKADVRYQVRERRAVPAGGKIISDELVALGAKKTKGRYKPLIRRISVLTEDDQGRERVLVLLTNQLALSAATIAEIYKERWQIELFFKALKQNLTLRSFVGTTENALTHPDLDSADRDAVAQVAALPVRVPLEPEQSGGDARLNLFTYRDLWHFLNDPWDPPPQPQGHGSCVAVRRSWTAELNEQVPEDTEMSYLNLKT